MIREGLIEGIVGGFFSFINEKLNEVVQKKMEELKGQLFKGKGIN